MKLKNSMMLLAIFLLSGSQLIAQINARMFRYPDVSDSHIVFSYAGDIWLVSKSGGTANKLSNSKGEELFARFSPDGSKIAYNADYDGNGDIYVVPVAGGIPERITYHSNMDRMVDWHPDGNKILFSSSRESGRQRYSQFYTISENGGSATKLPMPYGDFASFSPDGKKLAFNFKSRVFRSWKRYRGGWAPDLWIYDLENNTSVNFTENTASDEFPMWIGNKIFFLSDQGPNKRYNIWSYDTNSKASSQVTQFKDFDVHFPSAGKGEIVFEAGGKLYLLNANSGQYEEVVVDVITDRITVAPKTVSAENYMQTFNVSPDGKRLSVSARGEVFGKSIFHRNGENLS
ncbi:MAG: peptidase S41, partial [Bacteroidota bacterium]